MSETSKRRIRGEYRELIHHTDHEQHSLNTDELVGRIRDANSLFEQVTGAQEATLDSQLLLKTAEIGKQKLAKLSFQTGHFDVDDYLGRLCNTLRPEGSLDFQWCLLDERVSMHSRHVVQPTLMYRNLTQARPNRSSAQRKSKPESFNSNCKKCR